MDSPAAPMASLRWHRSDGLLAYGGADRPLWAFSYDSAVGKPHFSSLAPAGAELVEVGPADHRWHYGLWFSWKFINGLNYWEETEPGNRAAGTTCCAPPVIATRADGSATLRIALSYRGCGGAVELTELREIMVSAPAPDGGFSIEWRARFEAVAEQVVLGRTPMPGEPGGQVNGGYGGLGLRLPVAPHALTVVTSDGPISEYAHDRARPFAPAIGCNVALAGRIRGAVALLNLDPDSGVPVPLPWYVANMEGMRFVCAALLAPTPITLGKAAVFKLRYRALVSPAAWTPDSLGAVSNG